METKMYEVVKVLHTHTHTSRYYIHLENENYIDKHMNLAKGGELF